MRLSARGGRGLRGAHRPLRRPANRIRRRPTNPICLEPEVSAKLVAFGVGLDVERIGTEDGLRDRIRAAFGGERTAAEHELAQPHAPSLPDR